MRLAAVALNGGLSRFVPFPINLDVLDEANLFDLSECGAWGEGNSIYRVPVVCRDLYAEVVALGF